MVELAYCDGGSFSGTRATPLVSFEFKQTMNFV